MSVRVYLPVKSAEYAKLWGVSTAVARRRIKAMPGAVKIGSRWQAPILATEYAKRKGIKASSARKRKAAVSTAEPSKMADIWSTDAHKRAAKDAAKRMAKYLGGHRKPVKGWFMNKIEKRLAHADITQLHKLTHMTDVQWDTFYNNHTFRQPNWQGDDGISIGYYR